MKRNKRDQKKHERLLRLISAVIVLAAALCLGIYIYQQHQNDFAEAEYAKMRQKQ